MNKKELLDNLSRFTGTSKYYQNFFGIKYTEGVSFLANEVKCFWLLDLISSYQFDKRVKNETFQAYDLRVFADRSAIVTISDGNDRILAKQWIDYTGFPFSKFTLWYEDGVIVLPSEH